MELKGTVVHVGTLQLVGDKQFKKRDLILRINEDSQYPDEVKIQFSGDQTASLDTLNIGDYIVVAFGLGGRSYLVKDPATKQPKVGPDGQPTGEKDWFTTVNGWRFQVIRTVGGQSAGQQGWDSEASGTKRAVSDEVPF